MGTERERERSKTGAGNLLEKESPTAMQYQGGGLNY